MGYVIIKSEIGDKIKCLNDETHLRQYGTGDNYSVPIEIRKGEIYTVVGIAKDYFGSNKLVLLAGKVEMVVNPLYMIGTAYINRFEKVDEPGKKIAWVC
jgi:uncharacterized protein YgiM (DUF1202 family)